MFRLLYILTFMLCPVIVTGQFYFKGKVISKETNEPVLFAQVVVKELVTYTETNEKGQFKFQSLPKGTYSIIIQSSEYSTHTDTLVIDQNIDQIYKLEKLSIKLDEILVEDNASGSLGKDKLNDVEGTHIYAGKKTELIKPVDITANKAANKGRQIFGKIVGLNIWESDASGLQLEIGGRGLSPTRTSNFNTRQNGYDIAADALGYPESYYSPTSEAIDRIEIIRGAASLQYGTQFGGVVNFKMNEGNPDKLVEFTTRQTYGAYNFYSTYNSVGGQIKDKFNYYVHYNYKQGDAWRPNSHFESHNAYAALWYKPIKKLKITAEYTFLNYLAQQPGGLTDRQFNEDPSVSYRERNWFKVNWNVFALKFDVDLTSNSTLSINNFGLVGDRSALGVLTRPDRADQGGYRDLIVGRFNNFGNETRFLQRYKIKEQNAVFLVGTRYYQGRTINEQGFGSDGKDASFSYIKDQDVNQSNFTYPSRNVAAFAENIFYLGKKWSVTPGIRYEYIETLGEGDYTLINKHPTNPSIILSRFDSTESFQKSRSIFLAGIGVAFRPKEWMELYANVSQNYRAITFNDFKVANPNFRIDPNLTDEKGFTADLGFRGKLKHFFTYDISLFYMQYANRIGLTLETEESVAYRYRTNIGDSRNYGVEAFGELDILKWVLGKKSPFGLAIYGNVSWLQAYYFNTVKPSYDGKLVEQVPPLTLRGGLGFSWKTLKLSFQYSYVQGHYSDATNAEYTNSGIEGFIPSYTVGDVSASYQYKFFKLEAGVNNVFNTLYFTRRATGYPGPGIIPAEPLTWYVTAEFKLGVKPKKKEKK